MARGLQRYQIMEPLGHGSQGNTFRAVDRERGRDVAIKVLNLAKAGDWKAFDLFEREVKVLSQLEHPQIPRYLDYFSTEQSGDYFLVMEIVEGENLATLARSGRLKRKQLPQIFEQLLGVLDYLHSKMPPIIHRDIKPGNIVMTAKGKIVLVDFGGVRLGTPQGGSTMFGTFGYMAPEQLHGDSSPASDIYALGATMATLYTGVTAEDLPRDGLDIDLSDLVDDERLRGVLESMLAADPSERLRNVDAVRKALAGRGRKRRDWTGSGAARVSDAEAEEETALAISSSVRALARTPAPLSVLVWMATVFGSAVLMVTEVVFLPLLWVLIKVLDAKGEDADYEDLRQSVNDNRKSLQFVARQTSPLRD